LHFDGLVQTTLILPPDNAINQAFILDEQGFFLRRWRIAAQLHALWLPA
jgi:hypothetical protein